VPCFSSSASGLSSLWPTLTCRGRWWEWRCACLPLSPCAGFPVALAHDASYLNLTSSSRSIRAARASGFEPTASSYLPPPVAAPPAASSHIASGTLSRSLRRPEPHVLARSVVGLGLLRCLDRGVVRSGAEMEAGPLGGGAGQITSGVGPFLKRRAIERQAYTCREQFVSQGAKRCGYNRCAVAWRCWASICAKAPPGLPLECPFAMINVWLGDLLAFYIDRFRQIDA
jgi:hypothetical protein